MNKAYSYVRFSTPEQMRGDSFRRQTELARDYALKHKLDLDDKLTFHDVGVSAYRGKNSETGRLGDFQEAVRKGLVPRGSYLLVESLDRISRQAARRAFRVLDAIVDDGITVVTMSDGKAYDADTLDSDPMSLMMALLIFIRSNEESTTKARRLKEVWAKKRRTASEGPLTARGPAWLQLDADRAWQVDREKAKVVRKVFHMAADGHGQHHIAETLNGDGVPTFGDGGRRRGQHWHRSYVAKLLRNPAVVGTLVPYTLEYEDGKRKRNAQTPVHDYYPAIIKPALFEKVQSLSLDKRSPRRGRHAHTEVKNLLGGLGKCPICRGTMTRVTKGSRSKAGKPFLVCAKAKVGAGCRYRSVRLEDVERCLREGAGHLIAHVPAPLDGKDLQDKLRHVETNIEATEGQISKLLDAISQGPSPALRQRLRESETELEALHASEQSLWDRVSAMHGPLLEARLSDLSDALEAEPFRAAPANLALRQLLSAVVVNYQTGHLELEWLHGGTSEYLFAWPTETD